MVRTSLARRLVAVPAISLATIAASLVSASPAYAAMPTVEILCEFHLDNYVCGILEVTGFDNVPTIGWSINGQTSDQWVDQWVIYRRCAMVGKKERVTVVARGVQNGNTVDALDTRTVPCNCMPGN